MNNIFVLQPNAAPADIQDAIDERMAKLKGIVGCLLANDDMPQEILHAVLWAADGYLDELECLLGREFVNTELILGECNISN